MLVSDAAGRDGCGAMAPLAAAINAELACVVAAVLAASATAAGGAGAGAGGAGAITTAASAGACATAVVPHRFLQLLRVLQRQVLQAAPQCRLLLGVLQLQLLLGVLQLQLQQLPQAHS